MPIIAIFQDITAGATLAEHVCSGFGDYDTSRCKDKAKNKAVRSNTIDFLAKNKKEVCQVIGKTISSLANTRAGVDETVLSVPLPPPGPPPVIKPVPMPPQGTVATTPDPVKPLGNLINPPQYATLGIEYLHHKGLTGKGVKVGVIDDTDNTISPQIKELDFVGLKNPGAHGTFVIGLIAGRRPYRGDKQDLRVGVAPQATVYFEERPFTQKQGYDIEVTIKEPHYFYDHSLKQKDLPAEPGDAFLFRYAPDNRDKKIG